MAGAVLVCAGHPLPPPNAAITSVSSVEQLETLAEPVALEDPIAALQASVTEAAASLTASDGRVLDDGVRTGLGTLVERARSSIRSAQLYTAIAAAGALADGSAPAGEAELALAGELETGVGAVTDAVIAWEAEQARIAAEQEAARRAAEAAAAAAAAARGPAKPRPAAAVAAGPYVEGIWTSGGQAEIDACNGSVNMPDVAGYLGGDFYAAEHWSCGGRSWRGIGTGELVSFPGYGLYQVAGRVGGLPAGSYASALPSGYDGYYQTCMNGNVNDLYVWLLTRVG